MSTSTVKYNQPIYNRPKPAAAKVVVEPVEATKVEVQPSAATGVTNRPRRAEPFNASSTPLTPEQRQERNERRLQYVERLRGPDAQVERLLSELMLLKERGQPDWNYRAVVAQVECALAQAYTAQALERFVAAVVNK